MAESLPEAHTDDNLSPQERLIATARRLLSSQLAVQSNYTVPRPKALPTVQEALGDQVASARRLRPTRMIAQLLGSQRRNSRVPLQQSTKQLQLRFDRRDPSTGLFLSEDTVVDPLDGSEKRQLRLGRTAPAAVPPVGNINVYGQAVLWSFDLLEPREGAGELLVAMLQAELDDTSESYE